MRIAFRTDASFKMGTGHVMRCATLADRMRHQGADVSFICRELPGHYCDWLETSGYRVIRLSPPPVEPLGNNGGTAHAAWLGVPLSAELSDVHLALARIEPFDWMIVDHYALDAAWESSMRRYTSKMMVIDDLADRRHDADLLLDQNLQAVPGRYADLVPARCRCLLGPRFALLRPEFAELRSSLRQRDGTVRRVLVFVGGSDPDNFLSRVLDAWESLGERGIALDVVVGKGSPHFSEMRQRCEKVTAYRLHVQTPDMADLMADADLMIGAAGSTTWERCCLGLPAVLVSIAANQRTIGAQVAKKRAACYLGDADNVSVEYLARVLSKLCRQQRLAHRMSSRAQDLVDGRGAERVAAAIVGRLKLSIVSDESSWINPRLSHLVERWRRDGHAVHWCHDPAQVPSGDCAFYISCGRIVGPELLARNVHNLIVHESDLPSGRGWSPLTWQVLEGRRNIPITLFEARNKVDSGQIYLQDEMRFGGGELVDELREEQAHCTVKMCREFVASYPEIISRGRPQRGSASYYPRRTPDDSRLDPDKTLREQFNLLRVVDNDRYPAYFDLGGQRYILRIERQQILPSSTSRS